MCRVGRGDSTFVQTGTFPKRSQSYALGFERTAISVKESRTDLLVFNNAYLHPVDRLIRRLDGLPDRTAVNDT